MNPNDQSSNQICINTHLSQEAIKPSQNRYKIEQERNLIDSKMSSNSNAFTKNHVPSEQNKNEVIYELPFKLDESKKPSNEKSRLDRVQNSPKIYPPTALRIQENDESTSGALLSLLVVKEKKSFNRPSPFPLKDKILLKEKEKLPLINELFILNGSNEANSHLNQKPLSNELIDQKNSKRNRVISDQKLFSTRAINLVDEDKDIEDAKLSLLPEPPIRKQVTHRNLSDSKNMQKFLKHATNDKNGAFHDSACKNDEINRKKPLDKPKEQLKLYPPMPLIIQENDEASSAALSLLAIQDKKQLVKQAPFSGKSRNLFNEVQGIKINENSTKRPSEVLSNSCERQTDNQTIHQQKISDQSYGLEASKICELQSSFSKAASIDEQIDKNELNLFYSQLHHESENYPAFSQIANKLFTQVDINQTGYINFNQFLEVYSKLRKQLNN